MPIYEVVDEQTGVELELEGESPPTEEDVAQIYKEHYAAQPQPSTFDELALGFNQQNSDVNNFGAMMEAFSPTYWGKRKLKDGSLKLETPEETYGKAYMEASYQERREMLLARKKEQLREAHANVFEAGRQDSNYVTTGEFAGVMATPTSLAPLGQSLKGMAAIGALIGTEMSVLDQAVQKGRVDPTEAAISGVTGAVAAPLLGALGRQVGKVVANRKNDKIVAQANDDVQVIDEIVAEAVLQNVPVKALPKLVRDATGRTEEEVAELLLTATKKPLIPTKVEATMMREVGRHGFEAQARGSNGLVDRTLGVLSTRIGQISEPIKLGLRKMEMNVHAATHKGLQTVAPLNKLVQSLPKVERAAINQLLLNGNLKAAGKMLDRLGKGEQGTRVLEGVSKLLDDKFDDLVKAGYKDLNKVPNYFPRVVKDKEGLFKAIGRPMQNRIQQAIKEKKAKDGVLKLSEEEENNIINNVLRGYKPKIGQGGLGQTNARTIQEVDGNLAQYYEDPLKALDGYIRSTVANVERRKFFGQGAVNKGDSGIDIDDSISGLMAQSAKNLHPDDEDTLRSMLNARFVSGEQGSHKAIQAMRNMGYLTTIANPLSAATQIADLGVSGYVNGLKHTLGAMISPNKKLNVEEWGLVSKMGEEFEDQGKLADALYLTFKMSGFSAIDKMGKNVSIRAAHRKASAMVRSPKGLKKLQEKYGEGFGSDFDNLVNDLKSGEITENVKLMLWSELSDIQPISRSEMPQNYLELPNGRIAYALKSFTLKQLDKLRNDIPMQWKKGNKKQAIKNAIAYSLIVPTANTAMGEVKGVMLGRPSDIEGLEDVPGAWASNMFKMFGASEYMWNRHLSKGDLVAVAGGYMTPPAGWMTSIFDSVQQARDGELPTKILSEMPVIGRFWDNWMEGGLEKALEKKRKEQRERFK